MCVPGAIAATSAAMVIRKPAEAARLPAGPTYTTTGVFAEMIALLMSRVASSSPPGVCSVKTMSAAPSASAFAIADRMNSDATGWMMPSTVAVSTMGARSAADATSVAANTIPSASSLFISPSDLLDQSLRVRRPGIQRQRFLRLGASGGGVLQSKIRLSEGNVGGRRVFAPERDLEGVDRLARTAAAQVDARDQQVRLGLVRREEHHALQLGHRLAVLFGLVQAARALEMELGDVLLIALDGRGEGLADAARPARRVEVLRQALEAARDRLLPRHRIRMARRQLNGDLALAGGFDRVTRGVEHGGEHDVRVGVGRIAPQRLAEPVQRASRVAV